MDEQDFQSAALIYQDLLLSELPADLRVEVQTNLAAALCAAGQDELVPKDKAISLLDAARVVLVDLLQHYKIGEEPASWASGRANLALVHLARYRLTDGDQDVLFAHLALDGTEEALRRAGDLEMLGWIQSIRDYLVELRDRRSSSR
ncbi:hypothetical protein SAMN05428969_1729 [Devosia sp. YR412]|uniref:hypothetical protein n=1 Tax=Devosia sp. YR412 TaxID=1881030 RepID=UPI0008B5E6D8|nr:hypothetical protein [Devosia sp. YR412]SEQ05393.1 hypothetical protein SAMN05428969_1729 [Devosia sp. YR412]